MSGGRRKSRKPQKWEDYVADEEQLATIEKELEKEEKARMKNAGNDGESSERSPENAVQNEEEIDVENFEDETTDDEAQLEIVIQKDDDEEQLEGSESVITKEDASEEENEIKEKENEKEKPLGTSQGGGSGGQMIGDCTTCGILLRDWSSVHSHLRFHRLSHVPECNYNKLVAPLSKRINCKVCHRCCQNWEVLAYHAYTEHYVDCRDSKTCPFCSRNFKDMDEFQEHLDINIISFKCQVCGVSMNQEHKFYQHIVYCTKKHQLGITSLPCCICGITISINKLYNHLMQHSTLISLPRHLANNNRRSCELCGRSGFLNDEFLIRHCILRCSQRNNLQVSFAVIVSSLAKNQNMCFSETLRSSAMQTYLKLGIEAWGFPLSVKQFLEELQTRSHLSTPSSGNRRDSAEFTDVQLLAYLDQFEEKNREQDRELDFLLNFKSKGINSSQMEVLATMENPPSSNPGDLKLEFSERMIAGTEDLGTPSPCTNGNLKTSKTIESPNDAQVDLSYLMQHLRRGTDKRRADEEGESGPIDICLVTSTTNTQVTITPAGCHPLDLRPPKVARSVSHRPSVAEIRSTYPGVTVLSDVDFSRVPSVILEMQEMMSYRVQKEMEETDISPSDLQRLEVEAQFLREAEPFYLQEDPQWQLPKCNGIMNRSSKRCNIIPDPATLTRIIAEASVLYNAGRNIVLERPNSEEELKFPGKAHIARLLQEAQKFVFI